jgi:hypothetical protein
VNCNNWVHSDNWHATADCDADNRQTSLLVREGAAHELNYNSLTKTNAHKRIKEGPATWNYDGTADVVSYHSARALQQTVTTLPVAWRTAQPAADGSTAPHEFRATLGPRPGLDRGQREVVQLAPFLRIGGPSCCISPIKSGNGTCASWSETPASLHILSYSLPLTLPLDGIRLAYSTQNL